MGKRKAKARKPAGPRKREALETTFTCIFCHHDNSVTVRLDRKDGLGYLVCKICDQKYQGRVNHLTEPVDVYSEWIDAADAAEQENTRKGGPSQSAGGSRRAAVDRSDSPPDDDDDDDD